MTPILASHGHKSWLAYCGLPITLIAWAALAHSGLVNPTLVPPPERLLSAARDIGPPLALHAAATLTRVLGGFALAVVIGSALGLWMQRSRAAFSLLDGLIETWRPVPPVAMIPFFVLLFGFSELGRTILIVVGAALPVTVTVVEALHGSPPPLVRLGLICGLSRSEAFRLILVPAALPRLMGGFRVTLALVLSLVVVSEFLGARYGLGYLVSVAKVTLTTSTMLLCVFLLGLIGLACDAALRVGLRTLTTWQPGAKDVQR